MVWAANIEEQEMTLISIKECIPNSYQSVQ
jgi:hypothetical protein